MCGCCVKIVAEICSCVDWCHCFKFQWSRNRNVFSLLSPWHPSQRWAVLFFKNMWCLPTLFPRHFHNDICPEWKEKSQFSHKNCICFLFHLLFIWQTKLCITAYICRVEQTRQQLNYCHFKNLDIIQLKSTLTGHFIRYNLYLTFWLIFHGTDSTRC